MPDPSILDEILKELKRSKKQRFPVHIVGKASMITAPAGEVLRLSLLSKYGKGEDKKLMRAKAVEVAVSAIRFIENI